MNEEYQEIDLVELIKIVLRKWWLILLFALIAASASYYVTTEKITPVYKASTTLFIGKESSSITDISLSDLQVGNQLVTDYRELIQTNLVTEEVIKELNLNAQPSDLKISLTVETIKDSRFMHISYEDIDPAKAVEVADKLSEVLVSKAATIVGVKNIQIVDYAKLPVDPISPNLKMNVAIAAVLGMMIALMIIFINMMMINTFQKEEEIEKEIGLPVLGVIPRFKGEAR